MKRRASLASILPSANLETLEARRLLDAGWSGDNVAQPDDPLPAIEIPANDGEEEVDSKDWVYIEDWELPVDTGVVDGVLTIIRCPTPEQPLPADAYHAIIDWGDGTSGSGSIVPRGDGTFALTGKHEYAADGDFDICIDVTADIGMSEFDGRRALVRRSGMSGWMYVSRDVDRSVQPVWMELGKFFDAQPADETAYSILVDWGDGTTSPGSLGSTTENGWYVVGEHAYPEEGGYCAKFTVTKQLDGEPTTAFVTAECFMLVESPPTIDVAYPWEYPFVAGHLGVTNAVLSRFTGVDPNNQYTAVIDWGDGGTSAGEIRLETDGSFVVLGSHVYANDGDYQVNIEITASDGFVAYDHRCAVISHSDLVPLGYCERFWQTVGENETTLLDEVLDISPAKGTRYSVSIDWGDGSKSAGILQATDAGTQIVRGDHTYASTGSFSVTYVITKIGPNQEQLETQSVELIAIVGEKGDYPYQHDGTWGQPSDLYCDVTGTIFLSLCVDVNAESFVFRSPGVDASTTSGRAQGAQPGPFSEHAVAGAFGATPPASEWLFSKTEAIDDFKDYRNVSVD